MHVPLVAACVTSGMIRIILMTEDILHIGNSSPALKKKEKDRSLPQQPRTDHYRQPIRKPPQTQTFLLL